MLLVRSTSNPIPRKVPHYDSASTIFYAGREFTLIEMLYGTVTDPAKAENEI